MKRILALAILLAALLPAPAHAQGCGQSNPSCLVPLRPPGDNTNAAASTAWVTANGSAAGVTSFGPAGSPRTGVVVTQSADYSFTQIAGTLVITQMPSSSANQLFGNIGAGATLVGVPSCSSVNQALQWTTSTGFGCITISGTGGSVTSFSAGALSPLFTTSVATATTTPALSFTLSNAAANTYLGNATGAPAAPSYTALPSCSAGGQALNYTSGTGFGCVTVGGGTTTIGSGTAVLGTSAIAGSACATVVTVTTGAASVLATDVLAASFNSDPHGIVGYQPGAMLTIIPYPAAAAVNFLVCNNTGSTITPGSAITLNWRVTR
jgi:hypothetical protein